ncbi:MAG: VOC family protein [Gemmatimonadaceae bacterium]|nr:VOC family protein [Gemmatimonadaceae bacterium]
MSPQKVTPCLWFDTQAEEAAKLYVSVFKSSKIIRVERYPEAGQEIHGKPAGSVDEEAGHGRLRARVRRLTAAARAASH